jgi:uncharacterized protein (DUF2141 family)
MKNLFLLLAIISLNITFSNAQNKISVEVQNIKPRSGKVYIGLYNSESTFLGVKYKSEVAIVDSNSITVIFDNIPNGTYAISTFHDANNNDKMDKGMFGIPKEGYGFSNNAKGMFGPAEYKDASFKVSGEDVKQVLIH